VPVAGKRPTDVGGVATLANPNHHVDSVGDEVDAPIGHEHIEADRWVSPAELRKDELHRLEVRWDRHPERACDAGRVIEPLLGL
jgi:hypothetical protein